IEGLSVFRLIRAGNYSRRVNTEGTIYSEPGEAMSSGGSKTVMVPSGIRRKARKPGKKAFVSWKKPVTAPAGLRAWGAVPLEDWEPGGSIEVTIPLGDRRKPRLRPVFPSA